MNFTTWGHYLIRILNSKDIPQILEISKDIWDGTDYIPGLISQWIEAPNTQMVGIFSPNSPEHLLGFMRMNWNNPTSVWLEGGRIRASHQKSGLGKILLEFVLNKCDKEGVKIAQYDTSSRNFGSIALARKYGFVEKTRMRALYIENPNLEKLIKLPENLQYLTSSNAFELLQTIENGPNAELNLGWAYIPFTEEVIIKNTSRWIRNNEAITLIYSNKDRILNREFPDSEGLWLIVYGKVDGIQKLIVQAISNLYSPQIKHFSVFCPECAAEKLEELGFGYYENEKTSVILFEKIFD